jgi:hypothetical protein
MKQIKDIIILKKEDTRHVLIIPAERKIISQALEFFCKIDGKYIDEITLEINIKKIQKKKTREQLGYLYASVLPAIYDFLRESGYTCSEDAMKDMLKLHSEINWCSEVANYFTGEIFKRPKSFALATREEMSEIIDKLIRLAADFGIEVETPEDYKKRCCIT